MPRIVKSTDELHTVETVYPVEGISELPDGAVPLMVALGAPAQSVVDVAKIARISGGANRVVLIHAALSVPNAEDIGAGVGTQSGRAVIVFGR
jgi:hypothetical protein